MKPALEILDNMCELYWDGFDTAAGEKREELETTIRQMEQRITELEAVIKSHGIPVKTYSGGVAHYCTGIYDAKEEV